MTDPKFAQPGISRTEATEISEGILAMADPFDRRDRPGRLYSDHLVERHLTRRRGTTQPLDVTEGYRTAVLREYLRVTELAMQDEDVPPEVIRRVLDKVVYGCVAHEADAIEREQMARSFAAQLQCKPLEMIVTTEELERARVTFGSERAEAGE